VSEAGEGLLLDRRGQGFFVQSLAEHDLIALFRLELELLLIACEGDRSPLPLIDLDRLVPGAMGMAPDGAVVLASERLFRVFASASSPPLARHLGRLQDQQRRRCAPSNRAYCTGCPRSSVISWTSCRPARRRGYAGG